MSDTTNKNIPAVTSSEIQEWEKKFMQNVSPTVRFDKEDGKSSMKLYNGTSGIEATWSGTILLKADNYIKWSYSIQNGAFVDAKFELDDSNYGLIEKIYNFYTEWSDQWSKVLNMEEPDAGLDNSAIANAIEPTPMASAPGAAPVSAAPAGGMPSNLSESRRTKKGIIEDHSERMRKLAGLK